MVMSLGIFDQQLMSLCIAHVTVGKTSQVVKKRVRRNNSNISMRVNGEVKKEEEEFEQDAYACSNRYVLSFFFTDFYHSSRGD